MLPSNALNDLITVIEAESAYRYGTTLFKGTKAKIPAGKGPFVVLIRTGGQRDEGTHNLSRTTIAYERPSVQVSCIAESGDIAEEGAVEMALLLGKILDRTINGTHWQSVRVDQPPFDAGPDSLGRGAATFKFNLGCVKRLSPATS
jgi:hypothetical protein